MGISHHYKIVFMSSTTVCRAVSRARTWSAAVYRWVILPSGISSDCRCPLDVAGRKLCVKWKMNILVTFCLNFATRSASRYSLFQVWNVRKICQANLHMNQQGKDHSVIKGETIIRRLLWQRKETCLDMHHNSMCESKTRDRLDNWREGIELLSKQYPISVPFLYAIVRAWLLSLSLKYVRHSFCKWNDGKQI